MTTKAGHWCAFVCGVGWDRTILGIAIYDNQGELTYSRWSGIEKAITRGDWDPAYWKVTFEAPADWAKMELRLASNGNAMSQLRWEGGLPTVRWDTQAGEDLYRLLVLNEKRS